MAKYKRQKVKHYHRSFYSREMRVKRGIGIVVLVERTQSFTLGESLGFGLGSGLGYVLAVLLVTEARHRLRSKAIPKAFRGLPITLVYIGVLALAIYGFTGHSVIL